MQFFCLSQSWELQMQDAGRAALRIRIQAAE